MKERKIPDWLKRPLRGSRRGAEVRRLLSDLKLNTVCQGAACPNQGECWNRGTATFMIMGDVCTRNCRFCGIKSGRVESLQADEPGRVAEAAARLALKYVVVTSVTRDDLADGGASHFAATIEAIKHRLPEAGVEVLTPDYQGECLKVVLDACPTVFNHNLETCRRLSPMVRPRADYDRSLATLRSAAAAGRAPVKSGFMLGLGESAADVREMLADLKNAGVALLTIGQYLRPHEDCVSVERFVPPAEFEQWADVAREEYGFERVASAPLVRSSFLAEQMVGE